MNIVLIGCCIVGCEKVGLEPRCKQVFAPLGYLATWTNTADDKHLACLRGVEAASQVNAATVRTHMASGASSKVRTRP